MRAPIVQKGSLVSLRMVAEDDVQTVYRWINNPDVKKFIRRPDNIYYLEDEKEWFNSLRERKETDRVFMVQRNEESIGVGIIGVHRIDRINGHAEIGYFIAQEFWRKGYASGAVSLAIQYARDILNLRKLYAYTSSLNEASKNVLKTNGFKECARYERHEFIPGEGFQDLLGYELFL